MTMRGNSRLFGAILLLIGIFSTVIAGLEMLSAFRLNRPDAEFLQGRMLSQAISLGTFGVVVSLCGLVALRAFKSKALWGSKRETRVLEINEHFTELPRDKGGFDQPDEP